MKGNVRNFSSFHFHFSLLTIKSKSNKSNYFPLANGLISEINYIAPERILSKDIEKFGQEHKFPELNISLSSIKWSTSRSRNIFESFLTSCWKYVWIDNSEEKKHRKNWKCFPLSLFIEELLCFCFCLCLCIPLCLCLCLWLRSSIHHSDQMSQRSQVSKVA